MDISNRFKYYWTEIAIVDWCVLYSILNSWIISPCNFIESLKNISKSIQTTRLFSKLHSIYRYNWTLGLTLHHTLPIINKYIARNDLYFLYTTIEVINLRKPVTIRLLICRNILSYPIDKDAICELRKTDILPSTCHNKTFNKI